jgi:hypothetical protein
MQEFDVDEKRGKNIGYALSKDGMSTNNTATIAGTLTNPMDSRT